MSITLEQFVDCLGQSGLMSPAEIAMFQKELPADRIAADAATLAGELVRHRKLTSYQAALLVAGQSQGLMFGEYTVLDKVGEGGMGVVYRAEHRRWKRPVALKVLHPSVTKSPDAVKRFQREVEAAAMLAHPNIISAHDANLTDGVHYFVMEFVEGMDLCRLVKEQGPLPIDRAIDYTLQAARGLEHAHQKGVVHRDIKPSNLFLDLQGTVKILDMGLVRFVDAGTKDGAATDMEHLTQTGEVIGSVDYMAPEQAVDTRRVDRRVDIYSLGCTLFYLLTGRAPYRGDTTMQKLLAHREGAIPSPRKDRPDVPLALEAVLQHMLAKKADDRYASMAELIEDLQSCQEGLADRAGDRQRSAAARASLKKHVPLGLIFSGTLCILAVIGGNVLLAHAAAMNQWRAADELLYAKWYGFYAGIGMTAAVIMIAAGILLGFTPEREARPALTASTGRSSFAARRKSMGILRGLLGFLTGICAGAGAGAAVGLGLATHPAADVRIIGSTLVGIVVGAALGGRKGWLLAPLGALAGF